MQCPRAVLFDLDDTLAESFQSPTHAMVERLTQVLALMPVGILTAAGLPRMEKQFLERLAASPRVAHLWVFPNSAAQCYQFQDGVWKLVYNLSLTPGEREKIKRAIEETLTKTSVIVPHPTYTPRILDREAQIAFAALGLEATFADKEAWDPDRTKRIKLKTALEERIPEFEILIGGMTTIDITRKGINKAYGVRWLAKKLDITPSEMLYVGDALYEGGNDAVVIPTGIQTRETSGPEETLRIIDELLAACAIRT